VVEGVRRSTASIGAAQFSFSDNGSLVFLGGGQASKLIWVDRNGVEDPLPAPPEAYRLPRLSPDNERLAAVVGGDIWIYEIGRGTTTRLTFTEDNDGPGWTPDGERVVFSSTRSGPGGLFWKSADGSDAAEPLTSGEFPRHLDSIAPDGRQIAFHEHPAAANSDIWVLPLDGEREPRPLLQTQFGERDAELSPDGRWLAYRSEESGRPEIYVQPFPGPGGRWQISTEGGRFPLWARSGRELFYAGANGVWVVDLSTAPGLEVGTPRLLFESASLGQGAFARNYDVTAGGDRLIVVQPLGGTANQLNVVENWFEELKRLVPTS
jgi:Tol biopolymer transport system component